MNFDEHVSLKSLNTMHLDVFADYFSRLESTEDLELVASFSKSKSLPIHILGEGSNTLFINGFKGIVLHCQLKGRMVTQETSENVWVKLGAGENWHDFVTWTTDNLWAGVENLALIPGLVGAAPVQNIAAYGQDQADVFENLTAYDFDTNSHITLDKNSMHYGYRDSLFKHLKAGQMLVTSVTYKLSKKNSLNTTYFSMGRREDSIAKALTQLNKTEYTIKDVYDVVVGIRKEKLPDWKLTPTFGSYFKNPMITKQKFDSLAAVIPSLQCYPADSLSYKQLNDESFVKAEYVKVPVGRLLDHLGWANRPMGHVSTYNQWASIITHDGQATGLEIKQYADRMKQEVLEKFDIELEPEVVIF